MKQRSTRSFLEAASIAGKPPVLVALNIDMSRMMKALRTPDDIGPIIRIHKDLDRELKRIVSVMVRKSSRPKLRSMSQRIACLEGSGLSENRLAASQTINLIRNAFAHGEKDCFEEADVDRLLKAIRLVLGEDYTSGTLYDCTTDPHGEWDYRDTNYKGQFCRLSFTAIALVASIELEFEKHSFKPKLPNLIRFSQIEEATKQHTLLMFLHGR